MNRQPIYPSDLSNITTAIAPSTQSRKTKKMNVLLLGSSGFIGRQVTEQLRKKGYTLSTPISNRVDFMEPDFECIAQLCQDVDIVINMIGIMSQSSQKLEHVHHLTPVRIAAIAKKQHVKHWINLSALGASEGHEVHFVSSKGRGDAALLALSDNTFKVTIVRPSLVFGKGGTSCEMFIRLAKFPILILPAACHRLIQPVHVNDVALGLVNLAIQELVYDQNIVNFTGAEQCTLANYLIMMRQKLHSKAAPFIITLPNSIAKLGSIFISPWLPPTFKSLVSKDSMTLLEEGSIADNACFVKLLGRNPLGYQDFAKFYDPT